MSKNPIEDSHHRVEEGVYRVRARLAARGNKQMDDYFIPIYLNVIALNIILHFLPWVRRGH